MIGLSPGVSSGNTLDDIKLKLFEALQDSENKGHHHPPQTSKEQQKTGDHSQLKSSSESNLKLPSNKKLKTSESDISSLALVRSAETRVSKNE